MKEETRAFLREIGRKLPKKVAEDVMSSGDPDAVQVSLLQGFWEQQGFEEASAVVAAGSSPTPE